MLNNNLYRLKIKSKFILYHFLGIFTLVVILGLSALFDKFIETSITIVFFFLFRTFYVKQYHSKSLILCSVISTFVFLFVIILELKINISITYSVILSVVITTISYYVKDYFDNKDIIASYKSKKKCLENLTLDEMIELMPNIKKDILEIVYGYLHKDRSITAFAYSNSRHISEPLMYKYLKKVKDEYKSL